MYPDETIFRLTNMKSEQAIKTCLENEGVRKYLTVIMSFSNFRSLMSDVDVVHGVHGKNDAIMIALCRLISIELQLRNYFLKYLDASYGLIDLTKEITRILMCTDWPVTKSRDHRVGII